MDNEEFRTTALSTLSVQALQSFERLERTTSTNLIQDNRNNRNFSSEFYTNFIGVGAFSLGFIWGIGGTEKFPYAMKMEKMFMIISASQLANSNMAANKIEDYVPTEPTREHPDYYGALRKWRFQKEIARYTESKIKVRPVLRL